MGEQGGLRTGWIAAFSTEGYEGEPGLMEELGVNFGHIKTKVSKHLESNLSEEIQPAHHSPHHGHTVYLPLPNPH